MYSYSLYYRLLVAGINAHPSTACTIIGWLHVRDIYLYAHYHYNNNNIIMDAFTVSDLIIWESLQT